jgi:hypothetical protein
MAADDQGDVSQQPYDYLETDDQDQGYQQPYDYMSADSQSVVDQQPYDYQMSSDDNYDQRPYDYQMSSDGNYIDYGSQNAGGYQDPQTDLQDRFLFHGEISHLLSNYAHCTTNTGGGQVPLQKEIQRKTAFPIPGTQ